MKGGAISECLLAKCIANQCMDFYETFRKLSLNKHLKLITVLSQFDSRWLPRLIIFSKNKTDSNSFIDNHSLMW